MPLRHLQRGDAFRTLKSGRERLFASPRGRQNDRKGRNIRLRRGLPPVVRRILDMQLFFLCYFFTVYS
jgi:hypothetical protein